METEIAWTSDVPLVTNPVVLRQTILTFALAPVIVSALLAVAFWGTDTLDTWPMTAAIIFGVSAVLAVVGLAATALIYGNRMTMRFRVSGKGVETEVIDRRAKRVAIITMLLGLLTGKPGAAGSGLLAMANSHADNQWSAIRSAHFNPRRHIVELRNEWRTVIVLFCTPSNFEAVAVAVRKHVTPRPPLPWQARPLTRGLLWTVIVTAASLPSFAMPWPFEADLLPAMIMLCFAVACVWLLPLLAWALLAAIVWVAASILVVALEWTDSIIPGQSSFPAYSIASGDDWLALAFEAVALGTLLWFSWRCLTGRFVPVLMGDMMKMQGD